MNEISEVLDYFPQNIKSCILNSRLDIRNISEIRVRQNKCIALTINNINHILYEKIDGKTISSIFEKVVNYSVHTHQQEINNGFVTLKSGSRVGVCGTAVNDRENIISVGKITSLNFRVAKQHINCSSEIKDVFKNTIIAGPPSSGKTTFLRDIARRLASKYRVSVVDERFEICGYSDCFDLGPMCDCLRGYRKKDGVEIALRTLSPQVIIFDELVDEFDQIQSCLNSGVKIITTVHAFCEKEFYKKSICKKLLKSDCFQQVVFLGKTPGKVEKVLRL